MKTRFFLAVLIFSGLALYAQSVHFGFDPQDRFTIVERADYSKKVDGRYLGYVSREIRGIYQSKEEAPGRYSIEGSWYATSEMQRDGVLQALPVERTDTGRFTQNALGNMYDFSGIEGPVLRNFPVFPAEAVSVGDYWEAPMSMVVSDESGRFRAELPLYCGYTFQGEGEYLGRAVYLIEAQFAARYRRGSVPEADLFLAGMSGSHRGTLTIDQETLTPILFRDRFEEVRFYTNRRQVETRGFNLVFYRGVRMLSRTEVTSSVVEQLGDGAVIVVSDDEGETLEERLPVLPEDFQEAEVTVYEGEDGLTLTLNQLHFVPDRAELLPEDRPLLDRIAAILAGIPDKSILVTGHTADVGRPDDELNLSRERALTIVEELTQRGIDADRLLYMGLGAYAPLADNATPEGRSINRRVEITLLED